MESLQSNNPNSQPAPTGANQEANIYEDEINLMDYFRVLWKHKYFILLGSFLPALIVGLILSFWPRKFKVTYVYDVKDQSIYDVKDQSIYDVKDQSIYDDRDQSAYDFKGQAIYDVSNWNLNENNYKILLDRFYSAENTNKIKSKLQEYNSWAVNFEVLPSYTNLSKTKITNPSELEKIRQLEAQLLSMTITGKPENSIPQISLVIRDNFENVIPVYMIQNQLSAAIRRYRSRMANIEENRFNLELALKTNKAVLAKLKNIKTPVSDRSASNIALQFDISGKTEYLPAEYQIQAIESKTIQLEEQLVENEKKYNHYKDLLALNEKLFAELKEKTSSCYTIQQHHSFLTDLVDSSKNRELKDYLNSYIKRIENRISISAPVTEKPKVYAVSKGTAKKTAITFGVSLLISTFTAFLLESSRKGRTQAL